LDTWNVDLQELALAIKQHPTAVVLVVHNIGNIINVPELQRQYPNTVFVEDNCEGFLGQYEGLQSGTAGYASAISFFGNKNITCGEGGAFITNDEEAYHFAKTTHSQGQSEQRFVHDKLGYNFRMTNIQAALLYGQLQVLPDILQMKQKIFDKYHKELKDREDILIQLPPPNTEHANWMMGVRVPGHKNYQTAELYFKSHGIEIRPMFYPIYYHSHLANNYVVSWGSCDNAITLNEECFILPSYPGLSDEEQLHILQTLENYLKDK
jgi:perosamine synthetase